MAKTPTVYVEYTEWDEKGNVVTGSKVVASFTTQDGRQKARDFMIDEYMFSDYAAKFPPTDFYLDDIGSAMRICDVKKHDIRCQWSILVN